MLLKRTLTVPLLQYVHTVPVEIVPCTLVQYMYRTCQALLTTLLVDSVRVVWFLEKWYSTYCYCSPFTPPMLCALP